MAFKKAPPVQSVPDSPEKLFLELPRRKIPGVLLHQGEMMRAYQQQALNVSDVALQLPTGSGKTLWTCPVLVPDTYLIYAATLSNARGLLPPSVECLRRGL
jgi:hypothetical protein